MVPSEDLISTFVRRTMRVLKFKPRRVGSLMTDWRIPDDFLWLASGVEVTLLDCCDTPENNIM